MKPRLVLPAVAALAVLLGACSSDSTSASTSAPAVTTATAATTVTTTATSTASAPSTDAAATTLPASGDVPMMAAVDIAQFKFGPADVHVAVGGTVTWTNSDNQKHTATASGSFDTGAIEAGKTASATFDTAGTFAYICSFHPFMKGTVIVGS